MYENCITEKDDVDTFVQIVNDIDLEELHIDEELDEIFVSDDIIEEQLQTIRDKLLKLLKPTNQCLCQRYRGVLKPIETR